MTITKLPYIDALNCVKGSREIVKPNSGFQFQLQTYEKTSLEEVSLIQITSLIIKFFFYLLCILKESGKLNSKIWKV